MMDFRKLLNKLNEAENNIWKTVRRVQDNGRLTNFSIDDSDPFKLFTGVRNGGDNYSREDIVKVYYKDDERLQQFLDDSDGRNAVEVDSDGKPVSAPQTDAELDADSADNAANTNNAANTRSNGNLTLSDGTEYFRDQAKQRELDQKAGNLVRRLDELVRQMTESISISIRGYLSESDKSALLFEALSDQEAEELRNVYADLRAIVDFQDDQGYLISPQNRELLTQRLDTIEPEISTVLNTTPAANTSTDDADSADSGAGDSAAAQNTAPPAAAAEVSADSGDQDARVDPGEGSTSSSLEAFASSGKGGLANDADETAAIEELQQFLTDMGIDPNGVDGRYGGGTINAVKEFQGIFGATQDGDAGPETIGKIVEYRNDLQEMDDLVAAAGDAPQGGRGDGNDEVAQRRADAQQQNASIDFRHLISLVEGKLFEALDNAQRTRAEELIAKYEALVGNLPEPAKAQVQEKIDALKGALEAEPGDATDDGGLGQRPEPEAAGNEISNAVYKEVTGSGQGRRYRTFDADGNEVSSGRGAGPNLPTQNEYTAQLAQPTGDGPEAAGSRAALSQVRPDPADVGQTVEPRPTDSGVQGDYARAAWDRQYAATHNPDGSPKTETGAAQAGAEAGAEAGGTTAQGNVEPRPTGSGRNGRAAQLRWDRQYAETHNADGTPKTGSATATDDAAQAGDVTVSPNARDRAQAFIDRIADIDNMSEEELDAVLDSLIQDEEAFGLLTPRLQQQLRDIRG